MKIEAQNNTTVPFGDVNNYSTKPKISIIVPVYNVEQYLRCCLDSIVAQTLTDWECILIDDGSPDNSGAICDEYALKDSRFRVIHQENKGVSAARNIGLDTAHGEWIGFVDSDDWIEPNMYELLLQKCNDTEADIVSCNHLYEKRGFSSLEIQSIAIDNFYIIDNLLRNKLHGSLCLYLIKRKFFRNIHFIEGINMNEDQLVNIKLFVKEPKTAQVSDALYHYRKTNPHSATYSIYSKEKCQQIVKTGELIEQVLKENNLYQKHFAGIIGRRKYIKLSILYKSSLLIGISFYRLYPNLSKYIKIHSASDLFHKILLFNTEITNIPVVWFCIGFYKIFWGIKNRIIKR